MSNGLKPLLLIGFLSPMRNMRGSLNLAVTTNGRSGVTRVGGGGNMKPLLVHCTGVDCQAGGAKSTPAECIRFRLNRQ